MKYVSLKPVVVYISALIKYMIYFYCLLRFLFIRNKIIISSSGSQFIFCIGNIMRCNFSITVCYFNIGISVILRIRRIIPSIILIICRKFCISRSFTAEICFFYSVIIVVIQTAVYFLYVTVRYCLTSGHYGKRISGKLSACSIHFPVPILSIFQCNIFLITYDLCFICDTFCIFFLVVLCQSFDLLQISYQSIFIIRIRLYIFSQINIRILCRSLCFFISKSKQDRSTFRSLFFRLCIISQLICHSCCL